MASNVWLDAVSNGTGTREAAENWIPPLEGSEEVFACCETNNALIEAPSEPAWLLMAVESNEPQTATALVASIGHPRVYGSGRNYAVSIGLTPKQHSSGSKERLGHITRHGDSYVRTLPVNGASLYLHTVDRKTDRKSA